MSEADGNVVTAPTSLPSDKRRVNEEQQAAWDLLVSCV
jgi:hypothetical protein